MISEPKFDQRLHLRHARYDHARSLATDHGHRPELAPLCRAVSASRKALAALPRPVFDYAPGYGKDRTGAVAVPIQLLAFIESQRVVIREWTKVRWQFPTSRPAKERPEKPPPKPIAQEDKPKTDWTKVLPLMRPGDRLTDDVTGENLPW